MNVVKYELIQLEEKVEQGFSSAANALKEIKERKIYKDQYGTWENYLKDRWGYNRDWYYALIKASDVQENVLQYNTLVVPEDTERLKPLPLIHNQKQALELSTIKDVGNQLEVWEAVTDKYEPKEITAAKIREVKNEILEPEIEVIENNTPEIDFNKRFELMEDTQDPVIETMQFLYKEAIKLKAGKKYTDWLESYILYTINQSKL